MVCIGCNPAKVGPSSRKYYLVASSLSLRHQEVHQNFPAYKNQL